MADSRWTNDRWTDDRPLWLIAVMGFCLAFRFERTTDQWPIAVGLMIVGLATVVADSRHGVFFGVSF